MKEPGYAQFWGVIEQIRDVLNPTVGFELDDQDIKTQNDTKAA